jgi:hypothetical protein
MTAMRATAGTGTTTDADRAPPAAACDEPPDRTQGSQLTWQP